MASIRKRVLDVLAGALGIQSSKISFETTFFALGLDSARIIDLLISLEDEFETLIDDSQIDGSRTEIGTVTVGQLIALFEQQVSE